MDYPEIITQAIFGFSLLAFGVYILDKNFRVKKYGKRVRGTVISIEEEISPDSDRVTTLYHLTIKFKNNRGIEVTKKLDFSSSVKPSKKPPYKTPIFYIKENDDYIIVLAENKIKIILAYSLLLVGLLILAFVFLSATDRLETFKNYLLNLF